MGDYFIYLFIGYCPLERGHNDGQYTSSSGVSVDIWVTMSACISSSTITQGTHTSLRTGNRVPRLSHLIGSVARSITELVI